MKKTIKLTESDLSKLVRRIIKEQKNNRFSDMSDEEFFRPENTPYRYGMDRDDIHDYAQEYQNDLERRPRPTSRKKEFKGYDKVHGAYHGSNMGLDEFPEELRNYSDDLIILMLPNNNITEIPEWISEFKNLQILNLKGNPISRIPNSISELDPENGGSLYSFSLDNRPTKLKQLMPSISFR
jgi:hypothetical protein